MIVIALAAVLAFADQPCPAAEPLLRKAAEAGEQADGILDSLEADFPSCPGVLAALGRRELGKRNYNRANRLSEQAIEAGPDDPRAMALRGQMLAMQGRTQEGRELLERSVAKDPKNADACFQLGAIYDRAKLNEQAVAAFQKAIAARPSDPRAYDYLALNLEPLGRVREAEDAYKKGLAVNQKPNFDWFLDYNYGRLLLKLNRLPEAKTHLDRALELVPNFRTTNYDHAKLNVRLGEWQAARQDAERALSIPDPNGLILDLQVYNLLTLIYRQLGEEELARKYSELAAEAKIPLRSDERR